MSKIHSITPFSLIDYPNETSCIVWVTQCNFRCKYCHNPQVVLPNDDEHINIPSENDLYDFLKSRVGKLTAVVFSGGEATLCKDLPKYIEMAKSLGYKTKLDTNGTNKEVVKYLLNHKLLNYIGIDYKSPRQKFSLASSNTDFFDRFSDTLQYVIDNKDRVTLEVRTTVHTSLLNESDVQTIIDDLTDRGYSGEYYIQNVYSVGEKTLGNIEKQSRIFDKSLLNLNNCPFEVLFRNF